MSEKERILNIAKNLDIHLNKDQGQCILIDTNIADYIIEQANLDPKNDTVLEIGPGFGILTERMVGSTKKTIAIEQDDRLCEYLNDRFGDRKPFTLICDDALKIELPECNKVVSNLPYQISGPILERFILMDPFPQQLILMLQHEFIERLVSKPDPKTYSRLSALGQTYFKIKYLRKIPPHHFFPQPRVRSGIVKLTINPELPKYLKPIHMRSLYIEFLAGIFPYKNKKLKNAVVYFVENIDKTPDNWSEDCKYVFGSKKNRISMITQIFSKQQNKDRLREFTASELAELFQLLLE